MSCPLTPSQCNYTSTCQTVRMPLQFQLQGQNQQNQQNQQQQNQHTAGQWHFHINWSNFKLEFSGKPDEDAEVHLLHSNDWMNAHHFLEDVKFQRFCLTLLGEVRLWFQSIEPLGNTTCHRCKICLGKDTQNWVIHVNSYFMCVDHSCLMKTLKPYSYVTQIRQVSAFTFRSPALLKDKARGSSAGGLKVKALAQTERYVGSSPAQHYPFPCLYIHSKEISNFLINFSKFLQNFSMLWKSVYKLLLACSIIPVSFNSIR